MFTKRIIPCLDVKNGRVVKGVNFVDLKDAGDPVAIAKAYDEAGADELVFLDITASSDNRATVADMVSRVADQVFIPFTVGGGIRTVEDFKAILREGADKISVNSAAINAAGAHQPRRRTNSAASAWFWPSTQDEERTAAGIFTKTAAASIRALTLWSGPSGQKSWVRERFFSPAWTADGTKAGYDLTLTRTIADAVHIPVIASGGAGTKEHFYEALTEGHADAALAASLFHYKELTIREVKDYLAERNVPVRREGER